MKKCNEQIQATDVRPPGWMLGTVHGCIHLGSIDKKLCRFNLEKHCPLSHQSPTSHCFLGETATSREQATMQSHSSIRPRPTIYLSTSATSQSISMATREKDNTLASAGGMPPELGLCTAIVQKHRPGTHAQSLRTATNAKSMIRQELYIQGLKVRKLSNMKRQKQKPSSLPRQRCMQLLRRECRRLICGNQVTHRTPRGKRRASLRVLNEELPTLKLRTRKSQIDGAGQISGIPVQCRLCIQ